MNNISKKHHYIPHFYLAGFTDTGKKDGLLWVIDKNDGRCWQTKPSGIAFSKGYYDVETDKLPSDFMEKAFAFIEEMVAPVLKKIKQQKSIPNGEEYEWLILFLAIMAMRIPAVRGIFGDFMKKTIRMTTEMTFARKENFDSTKERMRKDGINVDNMRGYEELKEFVFSDRCDIKINQNWHILTMMDGIKIVLPLLAARNWMLVTPEAHSNGLICSDRPLSLRWLEEEGPSFYGPGFGLEGTFLTMPLSKELALFGTFEKNIGGVDSDNSTVTLINTNTCMYSERHLYFGGNDFSYFRKDMSIGNRETLVEDIKQAGRSGSDPTD